MRKAYRYVLLLSLLASHAYADPANPPGTDCGGTGLQNPLCGKTFESVVESIAKGLLTIATPIVAIMVIVGGFMIMTAGGNSEKVKKGKDVVLYAVIGFAVILFAQAVVFILKDLLGE